MTNSLFFKLTANLSFEHLHCVKHSSLIMRLLEDKAVMHAVVSAVLKSPTGESKYAAPGFPMGQAYVGNTAQFLKCVVIVCCSV